MLCFACADVASLHGRYVVEWPTRHACPTVPKHAALRAAAALATPRTVPALLLLLLLLVAAAAQAARQWRTLRVLGHGLRAGDAHAWRQAIAAMTSKARPRITLHAVCSMLTWRVVLRRMRRVPRSAGTRAMGTRSDLCDG
jgi:hypothetical protein